MQNALDSYHSGDRGDESPTQADGPGVVAMLEEILDLGAGLGIIMLPLFVIAIPGVILLLILPAVLLAAAAAVPAAIAGAIFGPPYLLVRFLRRHSRTEA